MGCDLFYPYAMLEGESDIIPHEVIEIISDRTLVVRTMACDLAGGWLPRMVLGFCVNQGEQVWEIKPDPQAVPFRIRLSYKHGWRDRHGNRFVMAREPRRWHRYGKLTGVLAST
jgi:hypothetical protein